MRYRRAAKKDANHDAIVAGLRAVGCSVLELHAVGGGCPDILVGARGMEMRLMEIKRPGVAGKARGRVQAATNEAQARFREGWRGWPVQIVAALDEALAAMGYGHGR